MSSEQQDNGIGSMLQGGVFPSSGSWIQGLGLEMTSISGSKVEATVTFSERHFTPFGVVHGGAYAMVVESVGSIGATTAVIDTGRYAVGVTNTTEFLRPFGIGQLSVVGVPIMQGRVQQLWEVRFERPADGKLIAVGRLRAQNLELPKG